MLNLILPVKDQADEKPKRQEKYPHTNARDDDQDRPTLVLVEGEPTKSLRENSNASASACEQEVTRCRMEPAEDTLGRNGWGLVALMSILLLCATESESHCQ